MSSLFEPTAESRVLHGPAREPALIIGGVDSNGARTKVWRVREKSRVGGDYIFEAALVLVQWPRIETVASRRPGLWEGRAA
jgi:hypothetical protein